MEKMNFQEIHLIPLKTISWRYSFLVKKKHLEFIEKRLIVSSYLTGNSLTLADFLLVVIMKPLFQFVFEDKYKVNSIPRITNWFEEMLCLKVLMKYYGNVLFFCSNQKLESMLL